MTIIGIVSRPNKSILGKSNTMVLDDIRRAVIKFNCVPISVLPTQDIEYYNKRLSDIPQLNDNEKLMLEKQIDLCDGIIMPGGEVTHSYDKYICDYCNKKNKPLLGICMGMQVMCNYDNENKNIKIEDNINREEPFNHNITIDKNSILYSILNEENIIVNSYHSYKVSNSGSYKVSARNKDVIEAVEKEGKFNIGVQWHPEKNLEDVNSQKLFKCFIDACKK